MIDIHPALELDPNVERKNESHHHWAIKSIIVNQLRSDPTYEGTIETEKKTSDLIGDIRGHLPGSPGSIPEKFVVEIETTASTKDRLRATIQHVRFGYAVYWVFTADAFGLRQETETLLDEYLSSTPSLGIASLPDGEISLGTPITWDEFSLPAPNLGRHELYVPTYNRYESLFDHGDFTIEDQRISIYSQPTTERLFLSRHLEDGQQTLPIRAPWRPVDFYKRIGTGEIRRVSPVRGPP